MTFCIWICCSFIESAFVESVSFVCTVSTVSFLQLGWVTSIYKQLYCSYIKGAILNDLILISFHNTSNFKEIISVHRTWSRAHSVSPRLFKFAAANSRPVSTGPAVVINQIGQNSGLRVFIKDHVLVQFVYNSLRADIKKSRLGRGLVDSFVKGS